MEVGAERVFGTYEVTREEVLEFAGKTTSSRSIFDEEPRRPTSVASPPRAGTPAAMTMAVIARAVVEDRTGRSWFPRNRRVRWSANARLHPGRPATVTGKMVETSRRAPNPTIGSRPQPDRRQQPGPCPGNDASLPIVLMCRNPRPGRRGGLATKQADGLDPFVRAAPRCQDPVSR